MDYQVYTEFKEEQKCGKSWSFEMGNDEYFNWTNGLKIDVAEDNSSARKRKRQDDDLTTTISCKQQDIKSTPIQPTKNASSKMPQWQVDDIADLNADIEGSLNGLGGDHSNNSFNMSEAILSLSSMTVFKQEAPSPTNNEFRQNQQSPTHNTQNQSENQNSSVLNTTLHQLLSQSGYNNLEGNLLSSQDGYGVGSNFTEDCRFQYVLAAATSIATKINEDTLTYLNQGQSYEIKLKKLGDLSMYRGKLLKSIIRICFHERRLQYMEKEQISSWQQSRPGDRILEIDVPLSYGLFNVIQPTNASNTVQFSWDPTKEVGAYIKVNCISTEFTPKKHGGEKGVPFRIQVETYQDGDAFDSPKRLHAAACQIKVFKLKGADRKHKQDREKILKRPLTEQEKYQPSYECTVLNDIPNESLIGSSPLNAPFSPDSCSQNNYPNQCNDEKNLVTLASPASSLSQNEKYQNEDINLNLSDTPQSPILASSSPQQTNNWLSAHRFEKYLQTFANFSGSDMLRMSREDLIQICGQADGIRLYNILHSKMISPKLTIYISSDNTNVFNAIYLSSTTKKEFFSKLCSLLNLPEEQVRDVFVLGPQSINVNLTCEVIKHFKDESMFGVEIVHENGKYVVVLKPYIK